MTDADFARRFRKAFAKMAKEIDAEIASIVASVNTAINGASRNPLEWEMLRVDVMNAANKITRDFRAWLSSELAASFPEYAEDAARRVRQVNVMSSMALDAIDSAQYRNAATAIVEQLTADAMKDFAAAISSFNARIDRVTRMTQQKLISDFFFEKATAAAYEGGDLRDMLDILKASSDVYRQVVDGMQFVNVNGRNYDPSYYAEMVARTKFHEAQSAAALQTAKAVGADLVIVSDHNTETPLCQEHEGKIYSISGDSEKYDKLEELPPFHPNCLHLLYPYFEIEDEGGAA